METMLELCFVCLDLAGVVFLYIARVVCCVVLAGVICCSSVKTLLELFVVCVDLSGVLCISV